MRRPAFTPKIATAITRFWLPHPVSVAMARSMGRTWGHGIDGQSGTIKPTPPEYAGYVAPPQLFTGWNPAEQAHVGTPLLTLNQLPATSLPLGSDSPLDTAMASINAGSP